MLGVRSPLERSKDLGVAVPEATRIQDISRATYPLASIAETSKREAVAGILKARMFENA